MTLYIAGTKNLFEDDSLTLGTLSVTGIDGQAQVFFIENSLKTVNGAYAEETLSDITGNSVILGKSETGTSSSSNAGGTTKPSSKPVYGNGANTNTAGDTEETGTFTVDKSGLEEAIKMAVSLEEQDYTVESYREMKKALSVAQQVFDDLHVSQQEVDEATLDLQNAIGAMKWTVKTILEAHKRLKKRIPTRRGILYSTLY